MQEKKILITAGGGAGNEALWRLLGKKYQLHFADANVNQISPSIPDSRRHQIPWASDSNFIESIRRLCISEQIDLLVPCVDEELMQVSENESLLQPTKVYLPDGPYIALMLDKFEMSRSLRAKGVFVPTTKLLSEDVHNLHYPVILKPRKGRGSRGVMTVDTEKSLLLHKEMLKLNASEWIVQTKMSGSEYTVQMIADAAGNLRAVVPVLVHEKRGVTINAEINCDEYVIQQCKKIHHLVPTKGCYNIQLILTADHLAVPFEINPRISTTFCMGVAAGLDPFDIFLSQKISTEEISVNSGIKLMRHWFNALT